MLMFLVRHGIAVDFDLQTMERDADRSLSEEGKRSTAVAAKGLSVIGCKVSKIVTSPLVRAVQTAQIMKALLSSHVEIEPCKLLEPGQDMFELVTWLEKNLDDANAMIVGHMPDLSYLSSRLLVGNNSLDILFKKVAVGCIWFQAEPKLGKGRLEWLLQPKHLYMAAKTQQ